MLQREITTRRCLGGGDDGQCGADPSGAPAHAQHPAAAPRAEEILRAGSETSRRQRPRRETLASGSAVSTSQTFCVARLRSSEKSVRPQALSSQCLSSH